MSAHNEMSPPSGPGRVLEDTSGQRRRRLRLLGRAVALVAFAWLGIVLLGGIGVGPAGRLPLGHALRVSAGPAPLQTVPAPAPPSPADLKPAVPAPQAPVARTGRPAAARPRPATAHGRANAAPGHLRKNEKKNKTTTTTATTTTHGRSAAAPGHTRTTVAPAKTVTTNPAGHPTKRRRGHTK